MVQATRSGSVVHGSLLWSTHIATRCLIWKTVAPVLAALSIFSRRCAGIGCCGCLLCGLVPGDLIAAHCRQSVKLIDIRCRLLDLYSDCSEIVPKLNSDWTSGTGVVNSEWLSGQTYRQTDWWMEGMKNCRDGRKTGRKNELSDERRTGGQTNGWMNRRAGEQMGGQTDGWTGRRTDRTNEWTDGGRTDGWTDGRMVGLTDRRTNERTDGRSDRRTDGRANGRTDWSTDGRTDERQRDDPDG